MSGITAYYSPGVAFWIAIRYVLDRCATVQEGVEVLREIPRHEAITFLLADPMGDMAVVEASPMKTAVRKSEGDFIVSTNHFNHPGMQDIDLFEPPDSRIRYDTIMRSLRNREVELSENYLMSILSSHKGLVCSHRDEIGLGTLWSVVANLNCLRIFRAEGHPCKTEYMEDTRLIEALNR